MTINTGKLGQNDSLKIVDIVNASAVVATWDGNYFGDEHTLPQNYQYYMNHPVQTSFGFRPEKIWNPHNFGTNMLLVDGHVDWVKAPKDYIFTYVGFTFYPDGKTRR